MTGYREKNERITFDKLFMIVKFDSLSIKFYKKIK